LRRVAHGIGKAGDESLPEIFPGLCWADAQLVVRARGGGQGVQDLPPTTGCEPAADPAEPSRIAHGRGGFRTVSGISLVERWWSAGGALQLIRTISAAKGVS
jgi:hypothetical protein